MGEPDDEAVTAVFGEEVLDLPIRRYERYKSHQIVDYEADVDGVPLSGVGYTRSVAEGGMGIVTNVRIPEGTEVEATVHLFGSEPVRCRMRCVFERQTQPDRYDCGFEFTEIAPEDAEYIRHAFADAPERDRLPMTPLEPKG